MIGIGKRLRQLREAKGLTQGDIEKRTGLFSCYVSRVECGHTVPMPQTVEKWAKALDVTMVEIFAGNEIPQAPPKVEPLTSYEKRLFKLLGRVKETDRRLFLSVANRMARQGENYDCAE
jgi:transcriptional regulator with XRE-family HTH domain